MHEMFRICSGIYIHKTMMVCVPTDQWPTYGEWVEERRISNFWSSESKKRDIYAYTTSWRSSRSLEYIYITSISRMILYINSTSANICPALMNCMDFLIRCLFLERKEAHTPWQGTRIDSANLHGVSASYIYLQKLMFVISAEP
jgi:hypothetical protein